MKRGDNGNLPFCPSWNLDAINSQPDEKNRLCLSVRVWENVKEKECKSDKVQWETEGAAPVDLPEICQKKKKGWPWKTGGVTLSQQALITGLNIID